MSKKLGSDYILVVPVIPGNTLTAKDVTDIALDGYRTLGIVHPLIYDSKKKNPFQSKKTQHLLFIWNVSVRYLLAMIDRETSGTLANQLY